MWLARRKCLDIIIILSPESLDITDTIWGPPTMIHCVRLEVGVIASFKESAWNFPKKVFPG